MGFIDRIQNMVGSFISGQAAEFSKISGVDSRVKDSSGLSFSKLGTLFLMITAGGAKGEKFSGSVFSDSDIIPNPRITTLNSHGPLTSEIARCQYLIGASEVYLSECPYTDELMKRANTEIDCEVEHSESLSRFEEASNTATFLVSPENPSISVGKYMESLLGDIHQSKYLDEIFKIEEDQCSMTADEYAESRGAISHKIFKESQDMWVDCIEEGFWPKRFFPEELLLRYEFSISEDPDGLLSKLSKTFSEKESNCLIGLTRKQAQDRVIDHYVEKGKIERMKSLYHKVGDAKEGFIKEWQENCSDSE